MDTLAWSARMNVIFLSTENNAAKNVFARGNFAISSMDVKLVRKVFIYKSISFIILVLDLCWMNNYFKVFCVLRKYDIVCKMVEKIHTRDPPKLFLKLFMLQEPPPPRMQFPKYSLFLTCKADAL